MENKPNPTQAEKPAPLPKGQPSRPTKAGPGRPAMPNRNTQVFLIVAVLALIAALIAIFIALAVPSSSENELATPTARVVAQSVAVATNSSIFNGSTVRAGNDKTANVLQTQIGIIDFGTVVPFPPTPTGPVAQAIADTGGQNWPMLGGNPAHTRVSPVNLKLPLKQLWSVNIGSDLLSSPAIVSNTVYVGSDARGLVSLDATTGKVNWYFPGGAVIASPAVANGMVFFGNQDNQFFAINATSGKQVWQFSTLAANLNSPAIADGVVYFGSNDGHLYAVDANTGQRRWAFGLAGLNQVGVSDSPAIADGKVFFATTDDNFYALNKETARPSGKSIFRVVRFPVPP